MSPSDVMPRPHPIPATSYGGAGDGYVDASLDSFEGVPEWDPLPAEDSTDPRSPLRHAGHAVLVFLGTLLPGVGLAVGLASLGRLITEWLGLHLLHVEGKSPISPVLLAILLGLFVRNVFDVPKIYEAGLKWCTKTVLRFGIVLLGLGLSIGAVAQIGLIGLPIIVGCIATALLAVTWITRSLGLPRRLGTLIAVGTSVCGVSAIVATAPAIDADEDEISYAVACITIFGIAALFAYPFLAHTLFANDHERAGMFLGTAIHDTAQVAGAGAMYRDQFDDAVAMKTAVTVKLVRNLSMSLLIPLLAIAYHRKSSTDPRGKTAGPVHRQAWHQVVPLFVLGFALMACLRSAGDRWAHLVMEPRHWEATYEQASVVAKWCLTIAMASIGLGTDFRRLRGLGWKPFLVGCVAALLVSGASLGLISLLM